jgi:cobalt-precorrin-5B (C1)-methyltransferase
MTKRLTTNLRFGWTTGTCATAAVNAAYTAMVTGAFPERVSVITPGGKEADLEVAFIDQGQDWAQAGIIKDAGDDPDVTHGAMIITCLRQGVPQSGVTFTRGDGIGLITKPGLPIAVGEPAINPVPRQMMAEAIEQLAAALGGPRDIIIEISVPDGAKSALKTWNPRLGIEGGLSILGTTGVVRPFSCSAWIASIHRGIDVARANGLGHVSGSTGSTSEKAVITRYDLPKIALMDMGDFVGGMLKYMRRKPVANLTIAGGFAKMAKLGQGAIDLHSARTQVDFTALADLAAACGYDHDMVANANSVLDVVQQGTPEMRVKLANAIAAAAQKTALGVIAGAATNIEILVVSRGGQILGTAGTIPP